MSTESLVARAGEHMHHLCVALSTRVVGSQGNRDATTYFARVCREAGWQVQTPAFQCIEWKESGADLSAGDAIFQANVSPFSMPALASARLSVATSLEELEGADIQGKIILLRGEIAAEQLAPKNFPWWNPEEHRRIIAALERGAPAAVVAATTRNPETAGAAYPFPLIEDGDFDIPSVYMTAEEGQKLAVYAGREIDLAIRSSRIPAQGTNVSARKRGSADASPRVAITAHIDAKRGTPGAIDDAGGITVLLLLAELLAGQLTAFPDDTDIELVAFNGEDYYSAPGEQLYVRMNGDLSDVLLNINIDGAGYIKGETHFSLYECGEALATRARETFSGGGLIEGPQWVQGDHTIFVMSGRPAIAITSEMMTELTTEITHTANDTVAVVDPGRLAQVATALTAFLEG
jgi:aminopeptidase YwaD